MDFTPNQILSRPKWKKWTREVLEIALPEPDGNLSARYNHCPTYSKSRIEELEASGRLSALRRRAERKLAAQREAKRQAALQKEQRLAALPAPSAVTKAGLLAVLTSGVSAATRELVEGAYYSSNPSHSRSFYKRLEQSSDAGPLAAWLLRAQKASARAKGYRETNKRRAYRVKGNALAVLCGILAKQAHTVWGWGVDDEGGFCTDVLYIDLPNGQVSFHSPDRGEGPDYPGEWDRRHASEDRVIDFAAAVLQQAADPAAAEHVP